MYGIAVGRRRADDAHVARPHEGELERARNGGGRHGECVDIHLQLAELFFCGHTKFLLFVDDEQTEVVPFHGLADEFVCADENIDLPLGQVGEHLLGLLGTAGPGEVFHPHGQSFETAVESLVVLESQHRGGHEHGHLLGVAGSLEGCSDGHLGLAEAHISAHESVHRASAFHVALHVLRGFILVGRVFVEERGLKLVLQIAVGTVGKALLPAPAGIEFDEVAGDVFDLLLGALLQSVPSPRTECGEPGGLAGVLPAVFAYLVERVDGDIHLVVVLIDDADHLLIAASCRHPDESAKLADAEIHMHDVVAGLHLLQLLHRESHLAGSCSVAA